MRDTEGWDSMFIFGRGYVASIDQRVDIAVSRGYVVLGVVDNLIPIKDFVNTGSYSYAEERWLHRGGSGLAEDPWAARSRAREESGRPY